MTLQLIRFPKPMKRGPKVKHGPCAIVVQFPIHHVEATRIAAPGGFLDWRYRNCADEPGEWELFKARGPVPTQAELEAYAILERRYEHAPIPIEMAVRMLEERRRRDAF